MENKQKKIDIFDVQWFAVRTRDGWERKVCEAILSKASNLNMQNEILDACVVYDIVPKKKVKTTERKRKAYRSEFDAEIDPIVDAYINFDEDELQKMQEEEERKYEYKYEQEISIKGYVYVKLARIEEKRDIDSKNGDDKNLKITNETWQEIRNITGVMGIYSQMNVPIAINARDVAKLRLEDPDARKEPGVVVRNDQTSDTAEVVDAPVKKAAPKVLYEVGDNVMIKSGAYINTLGQVEAIDLENKVVKLKITFFGRLMDIEMPLNSVEKI